MLNKNKRIIPDDLTCQFKQLFLKEYGLSLDDHIYESFKAVLFERMDKLRIKSPYEYYNYLECSPDRLEEKNELIDQITVGETYFFRNAPQVNAFAKNILPNLIQKRLLNNDRTIRIWSAGCSEGDEPYTIAIIINELLPDYENWDVSILATDINRISLSKARKGIYTKKSVKKIPEEYLKKYFKESGGSFHLKHKIKNMVTFERHNLAEKNILPQMQDLDILFCRNVTIYFELEYTKKLMDLFYELLKKDGTIFLGHSETLYNISKKFSAVEYENAFVYKKGNKTRPDKQNISLNKTHKRRSKKSIDEALKRIRTERVTDKLKPIPKNNKIKEKVDSSSLKPEKVPVIINKNDLKTESFFSDKFENAVKLANKGKCRDAIEILYNLLKVNNLHIETYYLLGILSLNLNEYSEAEKHFRSVLYNDPGSAMAHFNLAELFFKKNTFDKSAKEYENAIKILKNLSPEDHLRFSEDYTANFLLKVCRKKLSKIKV
jgi:chemotaxis protein methyltransferase CheR